MLVCIALLVHEIFGQHGFVALRQEKKQIDSLREEIRQLQNQNEQLDKRIKALQSDPEAIESLAREMHLARPGEIIYTSPEKDTKKGLAPPPAQQNTAK